MKDKNTTIPINQEEIATYLKDIRKLRVMTPEREKELAERMLSGTTTETEKKEIHQDSLSVLKQKKYRDEIMMLLNQKTPL